MKLHNLTWTISYFKLDGIRFKDSRKSHSKLSARHLIDRKIEPIVKVALADTRVVLIAGPRQAGKTTLARQFAGPDRPYITLDDAGTLGAARAGRLY